VTEQAHLNWDSAEQSLVNALAEVMMLLTQTPDDMAHTATRNRLLMAVTSIETAQNQVSVSRLRMPTQGAA
jgi:putative NIF3 family GTP cyclohydrolase 1 type 2